MIILGTEINTSIKLKKVCEVLGTEQVLLELSKKLNFKLLYCKECGKTIMPDISRNLILSYKNPFGFFPIRCNSCVSELKRLNAIPDKSAIIAKYRYGEEYWQYRWENHDTSSLRYFIEKYGEEEGSKKFLEKCNKTKGSLSSFISRYGEEEGRERFKLFSERSSHTKEKYIENYGIDIGSKKWDEYILNKKYTSKRSIEYWLIVHKGNIELAKKSVSDYQKFQQSLEKQVEKYGEEIGIQKFRDIQKKKVLTLENFIIKYGREEGVVKYEEFYKNYENRYSKEWFVDKYGVENGGCLYEERKLKLKGVNSLQWFIDKYGKENGINLFHEKLEKMLNFNTRFSKISQKLFWEIFQFIKNENLDIYFGELGVKENNEYFIRTQKGIRFLDFYIKTLDKCIEFDGEYWHKSLEEDIKRENEIKEVYPNLEFLRIRERDYIKNSELVIKKCVNFIRGQK